MAQVEFRDGFRDVPEYLESLLKGIDTFRFTYDEAIAEANRRMEADFIDRQVTKIRADHFRDNGTLRR